MYGIRLVLMLIVVGGVIAFVGDRIGMKVGRKRLSIFGLRPRHTGMVVTVVTGIVVSTTSLAVMSLVSQDVRTALFKMHEIQAVLATTKDQLSTAVEELTSQREELAARQAKVEELQLKIATLTGEIDKLSSAAKAKAEEYELLTARHAALSSELDAVKNERARAQKELARVKTELASLEREYQAMRSEYEQMKSQYDQTKAEYAKVQDRLEQANKSIAELQRTEVDLQQTIDRLKQEQQKLEQQRNELEQYLKGVGEFLQELQLSDITYRADAVILSTVIKGDRPMEDIRRDVATFLQRADQLALARGAAIEGSQTEAIIFFTDNLDNTAQRIARAKGEVVVRLVSATNAFVGQPVYAYLQFFDNALIFKKGEVVAEREIDGSLGADRVQDELIDLLMSANDEATRRGMVTDEEGRVGQAPLAEFNAAKARILELGTRVRVLAVASADAWNTKPPLKIAFQVVK